ncbi:3'-5' exonuclease [Marinobacter zhejiangensis]|uniref:DNA-directed DNA polymerase n=1 Tax=Marinobacter zhejiangensis TaxID=488535 RepID=A0A1I4R905_9GAMM|nr:3'-5' exonuclease [Marinobacter zhejiangensis]SFM48784.1 DNA polymerase-3 subunit epsilon [Marinobacter zhejiangensis]
MLNSVKTWLSRYRQSHPEHGEMPKPKALQQQPLEQARLVVLDLETTGLNPAKDQVIAIGAVAIRGNAIDLRDQFDLILRRPELDITETVLIHGIGPEALTKGHETEDALLHLIEWLDGDPVLAYHSAFDKKFLEKTLRQQLGYSMGHAWLDVAELLPAFFPKAETGGRGLDHWSEHFGLQASTRHHAAADAMVTAELTLIVLNKALKDGIFTLSQLDEKLRHWRKLSRMKQY